jgi:crossover junction endodeoxyribonuclease RuvC
MLVIGIDPGTETTGFGIISENDAGDLKVVKFGVIKTSKEKSPAQRLQKIYTELSEILLLNSPVSGAVEKLFFQRNVSTAIAVGQARGVILLALGNSNIEVEEYTPNEVKQSVTGYGSADKKQVQEMVKILLGMNEIPKPDDAADALAVAICHIRHAKLRSMTEENSIDHK